MSDPDREPTTDESRRKRTTSGPSIAFYGDDFTGSTDAMEALALNGVRTVLFLEPPDHDDLAAFPDAEAVGVTGQSRTMTPTEMDEALPPAFAALDRLDPDLVHYKVCSTFDSSPEVGSIGRAIDLGQAVFESSFVPLSVAAPPLEPRGRYVVFGNLFATVDGETYRLDRHPTMRDHPVTPMTEADLRRHLAEQTDRSIGLVDVRDLDDDRDATAALDDRLAAGDEIVCFDTLDEEHMATVGRLVWDRATSEAGPLFTVGSSGVEYALIQEWRRRDLVDDEPSAPASPGPVDRIAVVSGSASPVTAEQIDRALDRGFEGIRLDTAALIDPDRADRARREAIDRALAALAEDSVVCYSACGPDDPGIEETRKRADELGIDETELGRRLGDQQGKILRTLVAEAGLDRACVAGGDTSGHVARHLDAYALECLAPVGPGSPLCRARSRSDGFDGLEIALKGGQVQTTNEAADYFELVRLGGTEP